MYNPEMPPYVSHEEGTRLVIEYIEKFWCLTSLWVSTLNHCSPFGTTYNFVNLICMY
jgi:hypothetical protein